MMYHGSAFILAVFSVVLSPVAGFANGKVTRVCSSMQPHHKHQAQSSSMHNLTVDKNEFKPGDHIKVTLSGTRFEGFFIQARDTENLDGNAVGSFSLIDFEESQLLTCGHVQDSAVSHTSSSRKTHIEVYWIAPSNAPQHVQFVFSVVEKYKIYWVKLPGPIISQTNASFVTTNHATDAPFTSQAPSHLSKPFNSTGCGFTKFCVTNPSGCDPETDSQCFFLSVKAENDTALIEMSGPGEGYISFALSHDQWMGGDDAYMCVIEEQKIKINPAFITGRTHPDLDYESVLQEMAWRLADGVIQCSFRRSIHLPEYKERFNLDDDYYIFLADGEANDGLISRHHRQPLITSRKYDVVGYPENVGGSRSPLIIKAHGALMFVAWMTLVSIGVLVARFFKPVWPDGKLLGEKVWFQVHRILMVTTVILTCVAFVLPFVYRGGWSKRAGYHPYLGCIVMALAILQPFMAVFRPPPNSPRRPFFNWAHWSTGTTARIIAVAAMFLGMDVQALNLPDPWDTYTLIGFVLWHVFVDILLEIHGYFLINKAEIIDDDKIEILHSVSPVGTKGHTFKKVVLTIYICGNLAFLITFLAAINQM